MSDNPSTAWLRYKNGKGPLHDLTESIAKAIHESNNKSSWEIVREHDTWLAVGSWISAEAVISILPFSIPLNEERNL